MIKWSIEASPWPHDLFLYTESLIRGGVVRANFNPRVAIQIHHIVNGRSVLTGIKELFTAR